MMTCVTIPERPLYQTQPIPVETAAKAMTPAACAIAVGSRSISSKVFASSRIAPTTRSPKLAIHASSPGSPAGGHSVANPTRLAANDGTSLADSSLEVSHMDRKDEFTRDRDVERGAAADERTGDILGLGSGPIAKGPDDLSTEYDPESVARRRSRMHESPDELATDRTPDRTTGV